MEAENKVEEDIDLFYDLSMKNDVEPLTLPENDGKDASRLIMNGVELNETEQPIPNDEVDVEKEFIRQRKKSTGRSGSPVSLSDKDECLNEEGQGEPKKETTAKDGEVKEKKNAATKEIKGDVAATAAAEEERPISTFQQVAVFLALFLVILIINQGFIKIALYLFKPDGTGDDNSNAAEESFEYEDEPGFDRLLEH